MVPLRDTLDILEDGFIVKSGQGLNIRLFEAVGFVEVSMAAPTRSLVGIQACSTSRLAFAISDSVGQLSHLTQGHHAV